MRPATVLRDLPTKEGLEALAKVSVHGVAEYQRALEKKFGTLGPASPVRKIDPATGKVSVIIKPH